MGNNENQNFKQIKNIINNEIMNQVDKHGKLNKEQIDEVYESILDMASGAYLEHLSKRAEKEHQELGPKVVIENILGPLIINYLLEIETFWPEEINVSLKIDNENIHVELNNQGRHQNGNHTP